MMDQDSVFLDGEGDAWFKRNEGHLSKEEMKSSVEIEYICNTLQPFKANMNSILEIGCSNGVKLEAICDYFDAKGEGIEPSRAAVIDGNSRKKKAAVTLRQGTGASLPFESGSFDLVYFAFCLYLFDRNSLLPSFSEADRVLKPGGFLVITDFDPGSPRKRHYAHFGGVFSYKQDYARLLMQTHLYHLTDKRSFSHRVNHFDGEADERLATQILYKEIEPFVLSA